VNAGREIGDYRRVMAGTAEIGAAGSVIKRLPAYRPGSERTGMPAAIGADMAGITNDGIDFVL